MRTILTLVILWVITLPISLGAQGMQRSLSSSPVIDSIAEWDWDNLSSTWLLSGKVAYTYDTQGNILTESIWDNNSWVNSYQFAYTYDTDGNINVKIQQSWQAGTGWINSTQNLFAFDANGNLASTVSQMWHNGNTWVNSSQWAMQYDASNNNTDATFQTWDGANWINSRRHLRTFDTQGNTLTEVQQTANGPNWVNDIKTIYTHDASGNTLSESYQSWNGTGWANGFSYHFTYDSENNMLTEVGKDQWGNNDIKYTYNYDTHNNRTDKRVQYWDSGQWGSYRSHDLYGYDANGNRVSQVRQQGWNGTGWNKRDSTHYYYGGVVSGVTVQDEAIDLTLYPNPTNDGSIYIKSGAPLNGTTISVFNLQGQLVRELSAEGETMKLEMGKLPKGTYQIVFRYPGGITQTKRIVYQ